MDQLEPNDLREIVDDIVEALVIVDEDHRIIFFNRAAERVFEVGREEILGQDLDALLPSDDSPDHRGSANPHSGTRRLQRVGHETELSVARKNGETVPVSISFSMARAAGRIYLVGIARDVTESQALQERKTRADRRDALGRFIAEMTHTIRNPLMIIGLNARKLVREPDLENIRAASQTIDQEVKGLEDLLKEMNDDYRPRSLHLEIFDVHRLLKEMCRLASVECQARGILLDCRVDEHPAWISGDRKSLGDVFSNLINNAIEVMEEGGHLFVQSRLSDHVEISIADDGPGIPKILQDKVFTPFFAAGIRGSGIDLAVSRRIIDAHPGGRLDFKSQEQGGTVFKISFPLVSLEEKSRTQPSS